MRDAEGTKSREPPPLEGGRTRTGAVLRGSTRSRDGDTLLGALRTGALVLGALRTGALVLGALRTGALVLGALRTGTRSTLGTGDELGVPRRTTSLVTGRRASEGSRSAALNRERTSGLTRWPVKLLGAAMRLPERRCAFGGGAARWAGMADGGTRAAAMRGPRGTPDEGGGDRDGRTPGDAAACCCGRAGRW
jgi:hypothetical protein